MIGQPKRNFELAPYQSEWVVLYEQEAVLLESVLGEYAQQFEHVGSTSIPGMAAKPIIDIMVAVETLTRSSGVFLALASIGYNHSPMDTVEDRLFFSKEIQPEIRTHHLNLAQKESGFWKNQLLFRDYLRDNDQVAAEYIQLKENFVEYYARTNDLDREWKSVFVARVLAVANSDDT